MKRMHILYDSGRTGDKALAEELSAGLDGKYEVAGQTGLSGSGSTAAYVDGLLADNPDASTCYTVPLILSLNMAGFDACMTDLSPYINLLPVNIVVLFTDSPKAYESVLEKRLNITISFLTATEEDRDWMREKYPHLYKIDFCDDPGRELAGYLDALDMRFKDTLI